MSFSTFTQQDFDRIEKDYAGLRESAQRRCSNEKELAIVQKAFDFANEAHKNVRRRSGEPYIIHPIAVARIVVDEIGLGYKSIAAALLHDVVEDTEYTTDDIKNLFGAKIASLVEGLTKIKTVLDNEDKNKDKDEFLYTDSLQAENFKRILLTLNDDVRVVLIKLSDRLHNCRTIEYMPEHKRDKILSETMFIFIPLAHRLGLYEIKSEMENIWLSYKEPETFKEINGRIDSSLSDKQKEISEFIDPIQSALRAAGFDFTIKKRLKTPYSVWRKMQTKGITFDEIYDLYAVRIIFNPGEDANDNERDMCYHIFSIITGIYRYKPSRIRDWVKHPKSNGYEALHCTLMSNFGAWIEVQIRSKRMDDIAEKGIAAHWTYKKEGYISENDNEMDKWLAKVKDILVQKDFNAYELLDIIHSDLTTQEIVIFTPKGEQRTISKGSTALDFAYSIHTEIGNKAIAAKVNMKLVPLSYILKTGDQVEIITAQNNNPKKEWLDFLQTRHAINIVVDYLRDQGEEVVKPVPELAKKTEPAREPEATIDSPEQKYVIASCCHPIPGDPVIGFRNPDGSITVHKKTCETAESLASKLGDKIMVVPKWKGISEETSFPVRISLRGIDRVGLLNDISKYISVIIGANMRKIYLGSDEGLFEGYIELFVHDRGILTELIKNLSSIDGIQNVVRTDI